MAYLKMLRHTSGTFPNTRYVYFEHRMNGKSVEDSMDVDESLLRFILPETFLKLNTYAINPDADIATVILPQESSLGRTIIQVDKTKILTDSPERE